VDAMLENGSESVAVVVVVLVVMVECVVELDGKGSSEDVGNTKFFGAMVENDAGGGGGGRKGTRFKI
jgi:hypothetical protein